MGSDIEVHKRSSCPLCKISFGDYLIPSSPEGVEALKDYKNNQPLRNRITTIKGQKLRSLTQMNLYFASCQYVADNANTSIPELKYWNSKENVDHQLRVGLHFIDEKCIAVHPVHGVVFRYKSIAIKNLRHISACRYFDQAFELMATVLKMDVNNFITAVKNQMKTRI